MSRRLPCISHKLSQQVGLEHVDQNPCQTSLYLEQ